MSSVRFAFAGTNLSETTAVVLAGGLGTRLRSVVADVPKVLAPVRGRPFLAWLFDQLIAAGLRVRDLPCLRDVDTAADAHAAAALAPRGRFAERLAESAAAGRR